MFKKRTIRSAAVWPGVNACIIHYDSAAFNGEKRRRSYYTFFQVLGKEKLILNSIARIDVLDAKGKVID